MMLEGPAKWPKTTLEDVSRDKLASRLGSSLGMTKTTSSNIGMGPKRWPRLAISKINSHLHPGIFKPKLNAPWEPESELTDVSPKHGYINLEHMSGLVKGKSLDVHWFYKDLVILLDGRKCTESQVLQSVAQSVGSSFDSTSDGYKLDFNVKTFRDRLQGWIVPWQPTKPLSSFEARMKFLAVGVKYLSEQELKSLYSAPENELRCEIALGSDLDKAADERIRALYGDHIKKMHPSVTRIKDLIRDEFDLSVPKHIVFRGNQTPALIIFSTDKKKKLWL